MSSELRVTSYEAAIPMLTVQEYAQKIGKSRQAVMKDTKAGKIPAIHQDDPKQPKGKWMLITDATDAPAAPTASVESFQPSPSASLSPNSVAERTTHVSPASLPCEALPCEALPCEALPCVALTSQSLSLPAGTLTLGSAKLSDKQQLIALRRAQVCEEVSRLMAVEKLSLNKAISAYLEVYNTGMHHPLVFATLDIISPSTLRRWLDCWKQNRDWRALVPEWKSGRVGHEVPVEDFNLIVGLLHSDNKPPIASVLRMWHTKLRLEGRTQTVSDRTMERAVTVFARRNAARWAYMRRGAKYFREHYVPHVLMDGSTILPGDFYLSDGWTANFMVLNPFTNALCRPTLIPIMDYASRMIVGFDLDFSENRRVIASAFRNAITLWHFVPLYFKADNGKSFKSKDLVGPKMTRSQREELLQQDRDEYADIIGSIYATGVQEVLDSLPYNPTGKAPMERWFRTLDNGIARFLPFYLGNGIEDKPASLSRNEKELQAIAFKLRGDEPLSLIQAKLLIEWYIINCYALEPHDGIGGRKPLEVWQEGIKNIPRDRLRNPDDLWYLMMASEVKKLDRNGVKIRDIWYYDEALMDYVGRKVHVRYDQMDDRYVFVYDEAKNPICRALARHEHSPLVTVRGSVDEKLAYTNDMKMRARLNKRIKKDANTFAELNKDSGLFLQDAVRQVQSLPLTNTSFAIPNLLPAPAGEDADNPANQTADTPESQEEEIISKDFLDAIGMSR